MRTLALLALLALVACHGGKPTTTTTTAPDTNAAGGCEPGRCLPDLKRVIGDHRKEARACYDVARVHHPNLPGGAVVVNFEVDANGAVTEASQSLKDDQISEPEVVDCVVDVVKHVTFGKSAKGQSTRGYHRFEFSP